MKDERVIIKTGHKFGIKAIQMNFINLGYTKWQFSKKLKTDCDDGEITCVYFSKEKNLSGQEVIKRIKYFYTVMESPDDHRFSLIGNHGHGGKGFFLSLDNSMFDDIS